jgi:hypothetical protein
MDLIGVLKAVGLITIGDVDWVLLISKHLYHRPSAGRSGTAGFESVTQLVIRARARSAILIPAGCRRSAERGSVRPSVAVSGSQECGLQAP